MLWAGACAGATGRRGDADGGDRSGRPAGLECDADPLGRSWRSAVRRRVGCRGRHLAWEVRPPEPGEPDVFCTYAGEGMNVSVAVTMTSDGVKSFHAAGKIQALTLPEDMRLQRMLGHLPALVKDPNRCWSWPAARG